MDTLSKEGEFPAIPESIYIGDPTTALQRRPDVRMAERELAAVTALIGVVKADYFPQVTFHGRLALESEKFSNMGNADTQAMGIGPRITWAALDLGRVKARVNSIRAHADAQIALYEKTVLTALEETDNSLVAYGQSQNRRAELTQTVAASRRAYEIAKVRYEEGVADMLQLLEAERRMLETETALERSQTATALSLVALYKSLGGGWEDFAAK